MSGTQHIVSYDKAILKQMASSETASSWLKISTILGFNSDLFTCLVFRAMHGSQAVALQRPAVP